MGFRNQELSGRSKKAFDEELELLSRLEREQQLKAEFLTTGGKGISEEAVIQFGDELDLEDLSEEEQERRRTGSILDTGLIL